MSRTRYRGTWLPLVGEIRALTEVGKSPEDIAAFLHDDCRVKEPITVAMVQYIQKRQKMLLHPRRIATPDEYHLARRIHAARLRLEGVIFREIGERLDVCLRRARDLYKLGVPENSRVIREDARLWLRWQYKTRSRPIDMGGVRGKWLVFTPESNYTNSLAVGKPNGEP